VKRTLLQTKTKYFFYLVLLALSLLSGSTTSRREATLGSEIQLRVSAFLVLVVAAFALATRALVLLRVLL